MLKKIIFLSMLWLYAAPAVALESPITQLRYRPAPVNVLSGISVEPLVPEELRDELSFRYHWLVNDEEIDFEDGPSLSGEFIKRGDRIVVEVTSYGIMGEEYALFVPRPIYVGNAPPQFTQAPTADYRDEFYRGRVYAEDADGDELEYRLLEGPTGFELDADNGRFQWQPEETQGVFPVKIEVVDPYHGRAEQTFELELTTVRQ